ncbi:MAG: FemAB family XrtA/PEP-CTERM system-associated protein [Candidatus Binatia bacterium]
MTIVPCDDPAAWNDYVARHVAAVQYHRYEWLEVIERSFGHRPFPLAAVADGGRIAGVLPLVLVKSRLFGRFLVSLPFVNYGGLLADDEAAEAALWERAVELARDNGAKYLEARHRAPRPFIPRRRQHKVTMVLGLEGAADVQWKRFDAKLRNQVRKAEKSGLVARRATPEELPRFYDVFARCMRDLGTPVYDRSFFCRVLEAFPDRAALFLVERGDALVAGGIALGWRDAIEVPWAASLREYWSMCPNNLLYWALIRHGIEEGYRRFDFGRSTPGDGPYGFKKQWGAREEPLSWEYWSADAGSVPDLSPKNRKFQMAIWLWKHLPLGVTTRLGPVVVRGIP